MLDKTTGTCTKNLNDPKLFCSRGFDSIANPIIDRPSETVTPFTQIASLDVYTSYYCNPKILLDVSTFINSTLVRSEAIANGRGDIKLNFRIRKFSNGIFSTISPNYVYSKSISAFINESSTTATSSNSFEFQFCDSENNECCECITYVVEYYATILATGTSAPGTDALISLSTSISNITISALVFDSHP